jgi:hypothetical protein
LGTGEFFSAGSAIFDEENFPGLSMTEEYEEFLVHDLEQNDEEEYFPSDSMMKTKNIMMMKNRIESQNENESKSFEVIDDVGNRIDDGREEVSDIEEDKKYIPENEVSEEKEVRVSRLRELIEIQNYRTERRRKTI